LILASGRLDDISSHLPEPCVSVADLALAGFSASVFVVELRAICCLLPGSDALRGLLLGGETEDEV